jgi:hypothetical protein
VPSVTAPASRSQYLAPYNYGNYHWNVHKHNTGLSTSPLYKNPRENHLSGVPQPHRCCGNSKCSVKPCMSKYITHYNVFSWNQPVDITWWRQPTEVFISEALNRDQALFSNPFAAAELATALALTRMAAARVRVDEPMRLADRHTLLWIAWRSLMQETVTCCTTQ